MTSVVAMENYRNYFKEWIFQTTDEILSKTFLIITTVLKEKENKSHLDSMIQT